MSVKSETIGIDLGGTNIRIARISSSGEILEFNSEKVPQGKEALLDKIISSAGNFRSDSTLGIGLGIAGRVNVTNGEILTAGYLDLDNVPLGAIIQDALHVPAVVDNDAYMALFGEYKAGRAIGHSNIVMLTIGTGIGGALILNNQLFYGDGVAGQLGHITVAMNGDICNCGRRGCIETFSSGTILQKYIREAGLSSETRASDLFALCEAGDQIARDILVKWAAPLRLAADSLAAAFCPDLILLGGGLGADAARALDLIPQESSWFNYQVEAGQLEDQAGIIGAGLRVFELSNVA